MALYNTVEEYFAAILPEWQGLELKKSELEAIDAEIDDLESQLAALIDEGAMKAAAYQSSTALVSTLFAELAELMAIDGEIPSPPPPPPDGVVVTDAQGVQWTMVNGQVLRESVVQTVTNDVVDLYIQDGVAHQRNADWGIWKAGDFVDSQGQTSWLLVQNMDNGYGEDYYPPEYYQPDSGGTIFRDSSVGRAID
jgi:hypothetical protein